MLNLDNIALCKFTSYCIERQTEISKLMVGIFICREKTQDSKYYVQETLYYTMYK